MLVMQVRDTLDNSRRLGVVERRTATHTIPRQQQFKRYCRINAVPQKMTGERSER